MFVNRIKLSTSALTSGVTINIPLTSEYQLVDNSEDVEKVFVNTEVEKAINPIVDYEKVRFVPIDNAGINLRNVIYNVNVLSGGTMVIPSTLGTLGFKDEDVTLRKNSFTNSFLYLAFYDSDNLLNQNFVTELTIFTMLGDSDLKPAGVGAGQAKPVNQIPLRFVLSNPLSNTRGFYEGYYLYDYKTEFPRELFMRASLANAKDGKRINCMTEPIGYGIEVLNSKLFTKYILKRTTTGYYYEVDGLYSNNVSYINTTGPASDVVINLYQIQVL